METSSQHHQAYCGRRRPYGPPSATTFGINNQRGDFSLLLALWGCAAICIISGIVAVHRHFQIKGQQRLERFNSDWQKLEQRYA